MDDLIKKICFRGENNMKYTVITGASSGIGYETALALVAAAKT